MAGWFRAEVAARPDCVTAVGRVAAARAVDRVLMAVRSRRRAGADSHRRRRARRDGDSALQPPPGRTCRGAALDTRGEFAADAVRGDGRDQVAAAGQGIAAAASKRGEARARSATNAASAMDGAGSGDRRAVRSRSCPRVNVRGARATRAVLRACALLPERWTVELPPLGSAAITSLAIDATTSGATASSWR